MKIQVLGSGCPNCLMLRENVENMVKDLGIETEIEKITDYDVIKSLGVLVTPGLIIDGEIKSAGRVPSPEEIKEMLLAAAGK